MRRGERCRRLCTTIVDKLPDVWHYLSQVPLPLLLGAGGVLILLVGVLAVFLAPPRYAPQESLFTPAEWAFFRALEGAVGSRYWIFAKVRIADLVTPKQTVNRRAWWRAFRQVSSKHVDFVIVDRRTGEVHAAVELDDRSHTRQARQARDAFVDRAFAQAGIPLLRIPAGRGYDRRALADRVAAAVPGR
jgi:hypothetical protein